MLACYLLRVTLPATVAGGFASRCAASCAEVTPWPLLTSRYTFCYRSRWVRLAVRCAPRGVRAVMRWSATITSRHTYCYCGRGCPRGALRTTLRSRRWALAATYFASHLLLSQQVGAPGSALCTTLRPRGHALTYNLLRVSLTAIAAGGCALQAL